MKTVKLSLTTLFFTVLGIAFLNAQDLPWLAELGLKIVPSQYKRGMQDFLEYNGTESSGNNNLGQVNYNVKLVNSNHCFRELANIFYKEIHFIDEILQQSGRFPGKYLNGRPSLSDKFTDDLPVKEGYFWDLAIQYAGGNKHLALNLINICGHDDQNQFYNMNNPEGGNSYTPFANNLPNDFYERLFERYTAQPGTVTYLYKNRTNHDFTKFQEASQFPREYDHATCPRGSSMIYVPGSLGRGANISDDLTSKIIQLQAPTKGGEFLPAKYYHVINAAFESCLLMRRDIPTSLAEFIQTRIPLNYRSAMLCETLPGLVAQRERIYAELNAVNGQREKRGQVKLTFSEVVISIAQSNKGVGGVWIERINKLLSDPGTPNSILQSKLKRMNAELNAAYIYSKVRGNISENCNKLEIFPNMGNTLWALGNRDVNACFEIVTGNQCSDVKEVFKSWAIDFDWSYAQNQAGTAFASKNCPSLTNSKDPLTSACTQLDKIKLRYNLNVDENREGESTPAEH